MNEVHKDRNYLTRFCDVLSIEVSVLEGDYMYELVPNKTKLEVTLIKVPLTSGDRPSIDQSASPQQYRYKATLYDGRSPMLEGNNPLAGAQEKANRGSFRSVRLQLISDQVEYLRTVKVGGVYRDISGALLCRNLLTRASLNAKVDEAIRVKGCTLLGRYNTEVRQHIEIPHLTPLIQMPAVVEQKCGGIYATGFEWYLQGQYWYLFSPYDIKAYNTSPRSLTIINLPKDRYPNPEASYRVTPTQVVILATGETKHNDFSEEMQMNMGNAVQFIDAKTVFEDFGTVDNNKLTIARSKNINEVTIDPREAGLNLARQAVSKITANYLTEYSKLAIRSGAFVQLTWENGDADLIYPGMAVRLMYLKNNEAAEVYGTVVGTDSYDLPNSKHIGERRFTSQIGLTIFIDRRVS